MGQIEGHFDPFRYSVNLDAIFVHGLGRMCNRLKTFWDHPDIEFPPPRESPLSKKRTKSI
jgi:hypothetical protein